MFPVPGAPTENERSIESMNWSLNGSSSTSPLTANAVGGTGGSAIGSVDVDVLPVEAPRLEVVAEDARRAAAAERRRRAVLDERALRADEEVAPVRRDAAASKARFWRTPWAALVGWNAAGTGRSPRYVPSSAYRRTQGAMPAWRCPRR